MDVMSKMIQNNPKILGGQPIIKGTRVPVSRLMALIGMDYSLINIKKELPDLKDLNKKDVSEILSHYNTQIAG